MYNKKFMFLMMVGLILLYSFLFMKYGKRLTGVALFVIYVAISISNCPVKRKPSSVKIPIQINGLSNLYMPIFLYLC